MSADEDSSETEYPGLREGEKDLARLGVHGWQISSAAHAGKAGALPLPLLEILLNSACAFDLCLYFWRVRAEISLQGVSSKPLDRVPVFSTCPITEDRRPSHFKHGVLLETGQ
ncbi:MAG: hypothetical protein ACYC1L_15630 [Alphaproteobacteria bacterium]